MPWCITAGPVLQWSIPLFQFSSYNRPSLCVLMAGPFELWSNPFFHNSIIFDSIIFPLILLNYLSVGNVLPRVWRIRVPRFIVLVSWGRIRGLAVFYSLARSCAGTVLTTESLIKMYKALRKSAKTSEDSGWCVVQVDTAINYLQHSSSFPVLKINGQQKTQNGGPRRGLARALLYFTVRLLQLHLIRDGVNVIY